jgi:hypothetical protein
MAKPESNKCTKNSQRKHNKLVCHFCHFADSLIVQLFQTVVFQDDEPWEGVALRCGRSGMNVETKKQKNLKPLSDAPSLPLPKPPLVSRKMVLSSFKQRQTGTYLLT